MSDDVKYRFTIDQPGLGKSSIQVPGLGTFENGGTYDITKEEADAYRNYHQRQELIIGDNDEVLGADTVQGPTLLQASKTMIGVTVETVKSDPDDDPEEPEEEEPVADEPNEDGGEN